MVIIVIEILVIVILFLILGTLFVSERNSNARKMRTLKLKGYWEGDERRGVDRLNVSLEVKYTANGKIISAKSKDISTRGIRLLLDERIDKGTGLHLEIKLPNQEPLVKASGEVVWSQESAEDERDSEKRLFNTGIKFTKFQKDNEKRLFDFVHSLQSHAY